MKTVDVIRRENLHILAKEAGGPGGLADDLGKSKSQISQWLNASPDSKTGKPRTIGNASAREIEQKKNKPTGWMDVDHSPSPASGQAGGEIAETAAKGGLERGDAENDQAASSSSLSKSGTKIAQRLAQLASQLDEAEMGSVCLRCLTSVRITYSRKTAAPRIRPTTHIEALHIRHRQCSNAINQPPRQKRIAKI